MSDTHTYQIDVLHVQAHAVERCYLCGAVVAPGEPICPVCERDLEEKVRDRRDEMEQRRRPF